MFAIENCSRLIIVRLRRNVSSTPPREITYHFGMLLVLPEILRTDQARPSALPIARTGKCAAGHAVNLVQPCRYKGRIRLSRSTAEMSDHTVAIPPSKAMNSRRLIQPPP